MRIFWMIFIFTMVFCDGSPHDLGGNQLKGDFAHHWPFANESTEDTRTEDIDSQEVKMSEERNSPQQNKEKRTSEVNDESNHSTKEGENEDQTDNTILPKEFIPKFLADLKKNLRNRYSHQHFIKHMFNKYHKRIAYLDDLVQNNSSVNLDKDVGSILKSLQDDFEDNQLRGRLQLTNIVSSRPNYYFRRCLERTPDFASIINAEYNLIENILSDKDVQIPPELAMTAIRNLTTTSDSQRFTKIAHVGTCIFMSITSILRETFRKGNRATNTVRDYITDIEENTMLAIRSAITLRTLTASVQTAMSLHHESFTAIINAIIENEKPAIEVAPSSEGSKMYKKFQKCLKETMSAFGYMLPDEKNRKLLSMVEFAKFVGKLKYFSFVFECYLTEVESEVILDRYTHKVTHLDVWNWYESGMIQEMDIDSEYSLDEDIHNTDGSSSHEVSENENVHFDSKHRLKVKFPETS